MTRDSNSNLCFQFMLSNKDLKGLLIQNKLNEIDLRLVTKTIIYSSYKIFIS